MKTFLLCLLLPVAALALTVKPTSADLVYVGRDKISEPSCPAPCPKRLFHLAGSDGNTYDCSVDITYTATTASLIETAVQTTAVAVQTQQPTLTLTPVNTATVTPVPAVDATNQVLQSFGATPSVTLK